MAKQLIEIVSSRQSTATNNSWSMTRTFYLTGETDPVKANDYALKNIAMVMPHSKNINVTRSSVQLQQVGLVWAVTATYSAKKLSLSGEVNWDVTFGWQGGGKTLLQGTRLSKTGKNAPDYADRINVGSDGISRGVEVQSGNQLFTFNFRVPAGTASLYAINEINKMANMVNDSALFIWEAGEVLLQPVTGSYKPGQPYTISVPLSIMPNQKVSVNIGAEVARYEIEVQGWDYYWEKQQQVSNAAKGDIDFYIGNKAIGGYVNRVYPRTDLNAIFSGSLLSPYKASITQAFMEGTRVPVRNSDY